MFITPIAIDSQFPQYYTILKNRRLEAGTEEIELFEEIKQLLNKHQLSKRQDIYFISFYYDDPFGVINPEECRYTYGIGVKTRELRDIIYNILEPLNFSKYFVSETMGISMNFPYRNTYSFGLAAYKLFPKLEPVILGNTYFNVVMKKECRYPNCAVPSVFIWNMYKPTNIGLFFPCGDGYRDFMINLLPTPKYKEQTLKYYKDMGYF